MSQTQHTAPLAKDPNASAYARAACSWALAGDNRMMLMELERMSPAHLDELSLRICVLVSHAMELAESLQPSLPQRLAEPCAYCGKTDCTDRWQHDREDRGHEVTIWKAAKR